MAKSWKISKWIETHLISRNEVSGALLNIFSDEFGPNFRCEFLLKIRFMFISLVNCCTKYAYFFFIFSFLFLYVSSYFFLITILLHRIIARFGRLRINTYTHTRTTHTPLQMVQRRKRTTNSTSAERTNINGIGWIIENYKGLLVLYICFINIPKTIPFHPIKQAVDENISQSKFDWIFPWFITKESMQVYAP